MTRQTKLFLLLGGMIGLYFFTRSATGSALVTDILTSGSRGIRNNNPGNVRKSVTRWAGQVADELQRDPAFVIFTAPEYGIRAMAKILKSYFARGTDTIREIISTWAPASENDTAAYIASVAGKLGLSPDQRLSAADLPKLIPAIISHENGSQPYSPDLINKGISMS